MDTSTSHYQIHSDRALINTKIKVEYLLCQICRSVLWQPEKCQQCQSHFCKFCIRFSLLKSKKCPCCLVDYSSSNPDHYLVIDLNELILKCIYTYNGCNKCLSYKEIIEHENLCIYKEKVCEECNKKILIKDYHPHIIICKNSISNVFSIDFNQILGYFQEKLNKVEKENKEELSKLKKTYEEIFTQKEVVLTNLLNKMNNQQKIIEELVNETEKLKNEKTIDEFKINDKNYCEIA